MNLPIGADLCVGSLIKNPGGGLAPLGGYIAGRKDLVELAAYRLTAPGLGKEVGASLQVNSSFYQGLFLAPTVVASALKSAIFAANLYERLGFQPVLPDPKRDTILYRPLPLKVRNGLFLSARVSSRLLR